MRSTAAARRSLPPAPAFFFDGLSSRRPRRSRRRRRRRRRLLLGLLGGWPCRPLRLRGFSALPRLRRLRRRLGRGGLGGGRRRPPPPPHAPPAPRPPWSGAAGHHRHQLGQRWWPGRSDHRWACRGVAHDDARLGTTTAGDDAADEAGQLQLLARSRSTNRETLCRPRSASTLTSGLSGTTLDARRVQRLHDGDAVLGRRGPLKDSTTTSSSARRLRHREGGADQNGGRDDECERASHGTSPAPFPRVFAPDAGCCDGISTSSDGRSNVSRNNAEALNFGCGLQSPHGTPSCASAGHARRHRMTLRESKASEDFRLTSDVASTQNKGPS